MDAEIGNCASYTTSGTKHRANFEASRREMEPLAHARLDKLIKTKNMCSSQIPYTEAIIDKQQSAIHELNHGLEPCVPARTQHKMTGSVE